MTWAWTWRRCRSTLRRQPGSLLALMGAFAVLAFLAGAARLVNSLADAIVPRLADNVHVIAYLREDMTAERAGALAEVVAHVPGVERVRQVDSQEALQRLRKEAAALGGVAELLEGVEEGFLPPSLEIRLSASEAASRRGLALAERLRRIPGIAEVDAMEDGLARLHSILVLLRGLFFLLLALALLSAAGALALPLLQGRHRRRQHVAVLTLLGETPGGIRLPWALVGACAGLAGSAVAVVLLWLAHANMVPLAERLMGRWVSASLPLATLPFFGAFELATAFVMALLLGAVMGRLAVPKPGRGHA